MKGFGKIALMFGLLGGLMACFIIPVQFSRKRTLSPTESRIRSDRRLLQEPLRCRQRRDRGARQSLRQESRDDIWAGLDAMTQDSRPPIGSLTWCHYMRALWFK
jgi:hypothetical protein